MCNYKNLVNSVKLISLMVLFLGAVSIYADDASLPKGSVPIITAVEGNLIYYVNVGDKVEKGAPLFFIKTNDWPLGKIKQIKEDIVYYKKTYERNKNLAKTNAVSVQAMDDAWKDYREAINNLQIAKQQTASGFYTAPFNCEIVKRELPEGSGIADGNPVVYIKKIPASDLKGSAKENAEK